MLIRILSLLLFNLSLCTLIAADNKNAIAPLIPREALFSSPEISSPRLNPFGSMIAYLAPSENGILSINLSPVEDLSRPIKYESEKHWPVRSFCWSYNPDIIFYTQDDNGDENFQIYALNINTAKATIVTDKDYVSSILAVSKYQPNTILYSCNKRDPHYFDVWSYNMTTKEHQLEFKNEEFIFIIPDHDFKMRIFGLVQPSGELDILVQDDDESRHVILTLPPESSFDFLSFDKDSHCFYFIANKYSNTARLYRYDIKNQMLTALAHNDSADISGAYLHPDSYDVEAYIYNYEKRHVVPVNKQFAVLWNYLQNQIAGDLHIVSRTVDNKKWIIAACYDRKPHDFFLFDTEKNELSYLFNSQSKLEKYSFQKMLPVIIKSRDNLDLVSYFTPATGVSVDDTLQASEPKPLIILVHGGPVGVRDSWGFDATTQFLANRGYGVLSINYRGSGGFGKEFIKKSFGQWSLNMQNDLIDGLNWAIAQNITTPDQAIIMGGSYGGYATLVGLTMTPDLFAAGISIVGPSNLQTLLESVPDYWKPGLATLRQYLGLPEEPSDKDAAILAKMSPLTYASQLKKPLLIMQGANDPRVKQSESDQLIAALKEKQIPYLYALFPNEGHGFVLPENRIASFSIIEAFLSEIFKTRSQPSGDALRKSSVIISGLDN